MTRPSSTANEFTNGRRFDGKKFAEGKFYVVNGTLTFRKPDHIDRKALYDMVIHNLQILKKHRVPIAIGSDQYGETSVPEALKLYKLKAFDNLTLLKMWCEETAATIFPKRKIGHLKEGYEASFLVLSGNPLQDFNNVQKVEIRVKEGELLSLSVVQRSAPSGRSS